MRKFAIGFIVLLFFIIVLIWGTSGHNTDDVPIKKQNFQKESSQVNIAANSSIENPNLMDFILPFVGYVYGSPNTTTQIMLYWCYPKSRINQSVAISLVTDWPFVPISYNGERIPVFYRGYLGLLLPINFSQESPIVPNNYRHWNYKRLDVTLDFYFITGKYKKRLQLNIGNWTFEVEKEIPKLRPNITSYSLESIDFREGWRNVEYSFGLYNPLNVTIKFINISFKLPSGFVRIVNITVYNASVPYKINESNLVSSTEIPPGESRYFVITLEVDEKIKALFIQPKLLYSVGDNIYAIPGPPFQDTAMPFPCWYNYG
ncbi:hypothetical protein PNA2_0145 [Pyrococcus sp. NA2]|uniref:hypothetical protein n=1 Tax=Pyrococcus sp. (strain NA2) TaxID=342949 RepID=UPI000209AEC2|nr:hypothetical protein [Pyrococcus sp. NA2]AEC51063.1 hypothetical protein PNA2_0145 [Pyrococcus sp. NA2]